MAKIKYEESRTDREQLRDALRRRGHDHIDQIAQAIRERWHHGHLRSYRLALEWGQPQVCDHVNALQDAHAGDPGYLDTATLSRFEHWPNGGRRPTASQLVALARVFDTSPCKLIAELDWDKIPALDRLTLHAVDQTTPARTTEPAGGVGIMEAIRPQAGTTAHTPPNWWALPEPIGPGNPVEKLVTMTNDESTRYTDRASNTGPAIIDALRDDTAEVSRRFANANRVELLVSARMLRDRIFALLDGGQPIQQRRDLYFLSAAACGLLAVVSDDLGYSAAGMSQTRVAHVFATEAGDPALTGWLYAMQANFCYWNGQPGKARDYARRGAALHPGGTVGVWLPALEARASGVLGDADAARAAVRRAAEVRDLVQVSTVDQFGGMMHYNQAKQHFHAADAFLGIGDDPAAITEATAAVQTYQSGPAEEYHFTDVAITHFDAAIAHVRTSSLDAATESARAALQIGSEHRNVHMDKSARRLHHHLRAADVRDSPLAIDTRDQIEDFLSVAPARLELS